MDFSKELDSLQKNSEMVSGAKWAKFDAEGDKIEGTFVSSFRATSPAGQEQIVYVVKTADGLYNVGRSLNDKRVRRQMDKAKYGEFVRFVLTEIIPNKRKGFNAIKGIDAYRREDLVDTEWLAAEGHTESQPQPADVVANESADDGFGATTPVA